MLVYYSGVYHATYSSLWVWAFRFKIECYICNCMCAYRLQGKSMFVNNDEIVPSLPDALEELILHRNCGSYNTASSSGMCKSIGNISRAVNSFTDCIRYVYINDRAVKYQQL